MKNEKKKGGKRSGAGRRPAEVKKQAVTVYADVSRFGGKEGARMAIYEFLDGKIENTGKTSFIPLPADYVDFKKIGAVKSDGTIIKDLTKPTSVLKSQEQPKTNFSIDTKPKTLDELKSLCPAELTGFDRAAWISTERQKYGI